MLLTDSLQADCGDDEFAVVNGNGETIKVPMDIKFEDTDVMVCLPICLSACLLSAYHILIYLFLNVQMNGTHVNELLANKQLVTMEALEELDKVKKELKQVKTNNQLVPRDAACVWWTEMDTPDLPDSANWTDFRDYIEGWDWSDELKEISRWYTMNQP